MHKKPVVQEQTHFRHLEALGGLDMLQAQYYQQRFPRHVHDTYCISVIEQGAQRFYRSGAEHVAPKGDIILVNADDVHTGSAEVETGWAYRAIYPHPDLFRSINQDLQRSKDSIPWFPDAVVHDPGLSDQLLMTFNMLAQPGNMLLKETLLLSSLTWLTMRYSKTRLTPQMLPVATQNILNVKAFMDSYPERELALVELAALAELSVWHFLRQFKAVVGITPHAYLIQARLRKAKALLRKGDAILDVSVMCGFTDQSHFHRHFKNSLGLTPGAFAKGNL